MCPEHFVSATSCCNYVIACVMEKKYSGTNAPHSPPSPLPPLSYAKGRFWLAEFWICSVVEEQGVG